MTRSVDYIESDFRRAFITKHGADPRFRLWICNVGSFQIRNARGRQISYFDSGLPNGYPDLTGFVFGSGRMLTMELKGPSTPHPQHQRDFAAFLTANGPIHCFYRVDPALSLDENVAAAYSVLISAIDAAA